MTPGKLKRDDTILLVIDIQEKLMPVIYQAQQVFDNTGKLIKGAEILGIPVLVTEQYPKGLGHTCREIEIPATAAVIEKMTFSCMLKEEVKEKMAYKKQVILCGAEAHICVLKTALDLLENKFEVHVAADAISSRTLENKNIAIERLRQSGAFIESTEMILFQLLDTAGTDEFKSISKLIK